MTIVIDRSQELRFEDIFRVIPEEVILGDLHPALTKLTKIDPEKIVLINTVPEGKGKMLAQDSHRALLSLSGSGLVPLDVHVFSLMCLEPDLIPEQIKGKGPQGQQHPYIHFGGRIVQNASGIPHLPCLQFEAGERHKYLISLKDTTMTTLDVWAVIRT